MNTPSLSRRRQPSGEVSARSFDEHLEASRLAQRQADKWLISGSLLIGTAALGVFGLPLFLRGVWLLRQAQRNGLSVRPMMVTLIGYLVIIDAAINTVGWALDLVGNHTLLARVLLNGWGNMFDAGYFWHYNELWVGSASGLGEKDAYPILRRDVGVQIPLPAVGATGRRRGQGHRPGRVGHPADAEIPPARIP